MTKKSFAATLVSFKTLFHKYLKWRHPVSDPNLEYNYDFLPPLPMRNVPKFTLPPLPSLKWVLLTGVQAIRTLLNTIANDISKPFEEIEAPINESLEALEKAIENDHPIRAVFAVMKIVKEISELGHDVEKLLGLVESIKDAIESKDMGACVHIGKELLDEIQEVSKRCQTQELTSIQDYKDMFRVIPLPQIADTFETDATFAELRVAGPNPMMVTQVTAPITKLALTEAQYQQVMGNDDSMAKAIEEKRLYVCDYAALNGAVQGTFQGKDSQKQKYMGAPIALYAYPVQSQGDQRMLPVAVQTGQDPVTSSVILRAAPDVSDSEKANWEMAKTMVNTSDGNYHEAISHLGQTHMIMEIFALATENVLTGHPIGDLLIPHFEGTFFINYGAQASLIAAGGTIDKIMGGTIDQSRVFAAVGTQLRQFNFDNTCLKKDLASRGVDDPTTFPYYPYRDDALLVWGAIEAWAQAYVDIHYSDDDAVHDDTKLQDWLAQLTAFDGGRMRGIGEKGRIRTKKYLAHLLTDVMFTGSAQHAAVNFPQSSIMAFSPVMPLAGYTAFPDNSPATEADWVSQMPPRDMAMDQLNTGTLLGSVYYTRLGYYPEDAFASQEQKDAVEAALKAYQEALETVEGQIKERDPYGTYPYLLPSRIPLSINI